MSSRRYTRVRQWLLIATLAAALVGMHHLAAGHSSVHSSSHIFTGTLPVVAGASIGCEPRNSGPQEVSNETRAPNTVREDVSVLSTARTPGGCSCMIAMLGHQCLAVLAAAAPLFPLEWSLAVEASEHATGGLSTSQVAASVARDTPTSAVRLAELGISRR